MQSNNLSTFRILFLVQGILTLAFSLFFLLYIFFGVFLQSLIDQENGGEMPLNPGSFVVVFGAIAFVIAVSLGTLTLFASKYLRRIKNYTFIFVVAILNCFTGILGIILCVFTLIELSKPEVKALFENETKTLP